MNEHSTCILIFMSTMQEDEKVIAECFYGTKCNFNFNFSLTIKSMITTLIYHFQSNVESSSTNLSKCLPSAHIICSLLHYSQTMFKNNV